jgi:hypothetical protein
MYDHPHPYPLGWVKKEVKLKVINQHTLRFVISVNLIDELEVDVVLHDLYNVVFGSPYMYMRDVIFMRRVKQNKPKYWSKCHPKGE